MKALLLESIHPLAVRKLQARGFEVIQESRAYDEGELIDALEGVDVLGIRSKTQVSERVLASKQAKDLIAIGAFCIGTNQINLSAAAKRGVVAFNAPFSNTRSVVELVTSEIIALTRHLTERDHKMHEGIWDKSAADSHEVRGRTLGIVGYGNIGSQLSVVAEALGMRVIFYDTAEKLALGNAHAAHSLGEVLAEADVITLHVDGRAGNAGLFGAEEFAAMKPGSKFLNLSRGFVVDYEALRDSIKSGHITGAAVDVYPNEPKARGDRFESILRGLPNVILTPHVGGSTMEAQENIGEFVSTKLIEYVKHGATSLSVNIPTLNLEWSEGTHRIGHIHRNTPGVLATVNRVFGDLGVNISSQVLGTWGDVGYVVSDVGTWVDEEVLDVLRAMPETIRVRIMG